MKTLIFNGSPRKNGDTAFLLTQLKERLKGEIKQVDTYNTYKSAISPCCDCRYCFKNVGCAIDDEMQEIYTYIKECDNIIIASPIYFSELTGSLLSVLSRLQCFYASKRFLGVNQISQKKTGALILCGGGDGLPDRAEQTASALFKFMNAKIDMTITSLKTDELSAKDDENALQKIISLADFLNNSNKANLANLATIC